MLHDLSVGGLFGQQLSSSTLKDGLHGAEAGAHPWGEVEILPLNHPSHDRGTQSRQKDRDKIHLSESIQVYTFSALGTIYSQNS